MKVLLITRHAKASREDVSLPDFERPILPKGKKRTLQVCEDLKRLHLKPDFIITSSAKRTKETVKIIANEFLLSEEKIQENKKFYLAGIDDWLDAITLADNNIDTLMLVGHNPTVSYLTNYFSPHQKVEALPTSATACIKFNCDDWMQISAQNAEYIELITGK